MAINNYLSRSVLDDPSEIEPTFPKPPSDVGVGSGGGSTGTSGGGGNYNYSGKGFTPNEFPKNPYSTVNLDSWWGQLPFYMEKSFLNLVNRDSGLYSDFQKNLMKTLGGQFSTNSLLSAGMGRGGSYGSSQFLANEQMKQMQGKASDYAIGATDQFYTGMQGQATSLLNLMLQDRTALYNKDTQKMLAEMNQPSFWSEFGKGLMNMGGSALGGWLGRK